MIVPPWFSKELEMIDPRYYAVWNDHFNYFEVKSKVDSERKVQLPGRELPLKFTIKNPTIGVYWHLNDNALLDLRRRKYLAMKYSRRHRDDAYMEFLQGQWKEASEKRKEMGRELVAEGAMKIHQREHQSTFVMPSKES